MQRATYRKILAVMMLVSAGGPVALANTISFSHTTAPTAPSFTDTFTLSNFDTTLGTLTAVEVDFSYSLVGEVDIFNSTGVAQAFTGASSEVPVTIDGPNGLHTSGNAYAYLADGTAPVGYTAYPGLTGTGTFTLNVAPVNFSFFEAPAIPNASYSVIANAGIYNGSAAPGVLFGGAASAGGVTSVTYTYTSGAPEPSTWLLMGVAIAGFLVFRRRLTAER